MTGKTGTAQWNQGRELAWFAGFFPRNNPRFAYAVLYEGSKGEQVSGGRKAAPIIKSFLNSISSDLKSYLNVTPTVAAVVEGEGDTAPVAAVVVEEESNGPARAIVIDDGPASPVQRAVIVEDLPPVPATIVEEDPEVSED